MNKKIMPESAKKYAAPRDYPLSYPGKRPSCGFILANGRVWPVIFDEKQKEIHNAKVVINSNGEFLTVNKFLESKQASILEKRYAVIGYGSNPVPGQLLSKFGKETIVPVILGNLNNCDVVYNLISNLGYAFAEMSINEAFTEGSIGVTFLDKSQLRMMIETEQNYHLAYSPSDVILEAGNRIPGGKGSPLYMFAGFRKLWVPSNYNAPVPIAELPSSGRKRKALTQTEVLNLVISEFNLSKNGINTPHQLIKKLRSEARLEEKPGKLKYDIQKAVNENPRSLPPPADSLELVEEAFGNIKLFKEIL